MVDPPSVTAETSYPAPAAPSDGRVQQVESNDSRWMNQVPSLPSVSIHPGHFFLFASLPFCVGAYRGYRRPLERMVQDILQQRTGGRVHIADIKSAEEDVRRAVASAVASRALSVASLASVGTFGLFTASIFYALRCQTLGEAMEVTRTWAHDRRKALDLFMGTAGRVDESHPEVLATRGMTEEEEMAYISKMYLPDEEWEEEIIAEDKE